MNCQGCIFFVKYKEINTSIGICFKDPPKKGDVVYGGEWPTVHGEQVCGAFISKKNGSSYEEVYRYEDELDDECVE